jgi:Zn-dependent peptidase ImmA (M78 family)
MRCRECRFWEEILPALDPIAPSRDPWNRQGECRRRAPLIRVPRGDLHLPWQQARSHRVAAAELLRWAEVNAPPVPIEMVCARLGVRVQKINQPGWDGALTIQGDQATIWVNAGVAPQRQRFTIGHELGHLVLHRGTMEFRDHITMTGVDPKEREANRYAAELLMPESFIRAFSMGRTPEQLAALFEVSPQAMGIRRQALRRGRAF